MSKLATGILVVLLCFSAVHSQLNCQHTRQEGPAPSEAEIGELLSKASEYVDTYKQTFINTKASLDKAPTPGFYAKAMEECSDASVIIAMIKKNGSTGVALMTLIVTLDDMSLNAARASAATMIVALSENKTNPSDHAMHDFQDIAQAEKNCYDISELLFHAAIRYVSAEERALGILLHNRNH